MSFTFKPTATYTRMRSARPETRVLTVSVCCDIAGRLVSKYGPQLAEGEAGPQRLEALERLLKACTSFVRKPALTALAKLRKSLA